MSDEPHDRRRTGSRDRYGQRPSNDTYSHYAQSEQDSAKDSARYPQQDDSAQYARHDNDERDRFDCYRNEDEAYESRQQQRREFDRGESYTDEQSALVETYRREDEDYESRRMQRTFNDDEESQRYNAYRRGDEKRRPSLAPRSRPLPPSDRDNRLRDSGHDFARSRGESSHRSRRDDEFPRRAGRLQTAFVESVKVSAKVTKRASNKLIERFKALQPVQRVMVVALILFACVGPTVVGTIAGISTFTTLKSVATSGQAELTAIKTLFSSTDKGQSIQVKMKDFLSPTVLGQVKVHCDNALGDFQQLNDQINSNSGILGIASFIPILGGKLNSVGHLAKVGVDGALLCQDFATSGGALAPIFATSLFSPDGPPLLTTDTFGAIGDLLAKMQSHVDDIGSQMSQVNIDDIPLPANLHAQLVPLVGQIPGFVHTFDGISSNLPMLKWALGVDSKRNYLIQTMDRGELRPGGGFTGQYGDLSLTGGRLGKISLTDVTLADFSSGAGSSQLPQQYASWWSEDGFGFRDSNLSGDFANSAHLAIKTYRHDFPQSQPVDGVIAFSVVIIQHLIAPDALGPLHIDCYNEDITQQNLEDRIHYYQDDYAGRAIQAKCSAGNAANTSERKQFTAALASKFQEKLRGMPSDQIGGVLKSLSNDMQDKNIQIYFSNPDSQAQWQKDGLAGTMIHDPKIDATDIVQANIGTNKGSIYAQTKVQENITLDSAGNAKHDLTIVLSYKPGTNKVFGYIDPTNAVTHETRDYRDYIRVYAPASAQFVSGTGFDQAHIGWTPSSVLCSVTLDCKPNNAPICDSGTFAPGQIPPSIGYLAGSGTWDPEHLRTDHIDKIAGPTNTTSDEDGRAMFGGLVVVPSGCVATVTLKWTVPHAVSDPNSGAYSFTEESQSGAWNDVTISIKPADGVNLTPTDTHVAQQFGSITVQPSH